MAAGRYDNKSMQELLAATEKLGMTREHLNLWHPREEVQFKKTPEFRFEDGHKKAVLALMKEKKLSALSAIQEVSRLSAAEARALVDLYDLGVNGQYIRDHRHEHNFTAWGFDRMLRKLITVHKLSLVEALSEMKGLCTLERNMLAKYYGNGLRAETLRSLRGDISISDFSLSYSKKPEKIEDLRRLYSYFDGEVEEERRSYIAAVIQADLKQNKSWEDILNNAAHEARLIKDNLGSGSDKRRKISLETYPPTTSQRVHFLNRHIHEGVRAQDVPEAFSDHHRAMYRILRVVHRLSVQDALKEMAGLNEEQVHLLRKYYKAGVRCHDLAAYPHQAKQTQELLAHFHLLPGKGLQDLASLNAMQFSCLSTFANDGLTLQEAKQLRGELNQLKKDVVRELIKGGVQIETALQKALPGTDEEAAKLLQEPLSEFERGMTIKL